MARSRHILAALLLLAAASPVLAQDARPSPPTGPSPRGKAAPPATFAEVRGWKMLRWDMSPDEVRKSLQAKGIAFTESEMTGFFGAPTPPSGSGDGPSFVEAAFTHFELEDGRWRVHAELMGWRLRSVSLTSPPLSSKAVEAELRDLARRYGPPASSWPPSSVPGAQRALWSNEKTSLTVTTAPVDGGWVVQVRYQRLPVTWP